ncbi:hypothetical protein VB735_06995 [Halotia wernerae UHCC 0503]|nr:hypothetical protein [Halotia wernerae UHCC 0503]
MSTLKNLSLSSLGAMLIALGITDAANASQLFGDSKPLGEGFVRSFVTLDEQGNPSEVGLTLTQEALSVPVGDSAADIAVFLSLPPEASSLPFNHIELTYRPRGYPWLPPIFAVPRFTVDAFLISPQERTLICPDADINNPQSTCQPDQLARATKQPKPELVPQGFLPTGIVEPGKGARYFDSDLLPPIIQGQTPFTTLYDYAFADGQVSLIGIGSTKAFLETQPNINNSIEIPFSYSQSGYYPTSYSINFDPTSQEYQLAMTGFKYRTVPEFSTTFGLLLLGVIGAVSQFKKTKTNQ